LTITKRLIIQIDGTQFEKFILQTSDNLSLLAFEVFG